MCFAAIHENYHLSPMRGMRTSGGLLVSTVVLAAISLGACDKSGSTGATTPTASSEESEPRESRPSRAEVACHLHSCAPPRYCNRDKGVCELLPCTESRDCPYGYKCDFSRNVCQ